MVLQQLREKRQIHAIIISLDKIQSQLEKNFCWSGAGSFLKIGMEGKHLTCQIFIKDYLAFISQEAVTPCQFTRVIRAFKPCILKKSFFHF